MALLTLENSAKISASILCPQITNSASIFIDFALYLVLALYLVPLFLCFVVFDEYRYLYFGCGCVGVGVGVGVLFSPPTSVQRSAAGRQPVSCSAKKAAVIIVHVPVRYNVQY